MEIITSLIEQYALWIFVGLALAALWYIQAIWRSHRRFGISVYGLEREAASIDRSRAFSMLLVVGALSSLVYLTSQYISPNLTLFLPEEATPAVILMTAKPTLTPDIFIVLPGQPTPTLAGSPTPIFVNTALPAGGVGCNNPLATIISPLPGAVIAGLVEVQGVASIPDFAFYVLEISTLGGNWLNLYTHNEPVSGGVIGQWDTSLYSVGDYSFRLVVYDASGAFAEPCTIPITIGGVP